MRVRYKEHCQQYQFLKFYFAHLILPELVFY
jgi:hypothetical protein